jgi:5-oxoprolinase (ATP-hydrolysing)
MNEGEPGEVGKNFAFRWNGDRTKLEKISLGGKAELLLQPGERLQVNPPAVGGWGIPKPQMLYIC